MKKLGAGPDIRVFVSLAIEMVSSMPCIYCRDVRKDEVQSEVSRVSLLGRYALTTPVGKAQILPPS